MVSKSVVPFEHVMFPWASPTSHRILIISIQINTCLSQFQLLSLSMLIPEEKAGRKFARTSSHPAHNSVELFIRSRSWWQGCKLSHFHSTDLFDLLFRCWTNWFVSRINFNKHIFLKQLTSFVHLFFRVSLPLLELSQQLDGQIRQWATISLRAIQELPDVRTYR